MSEPLSEADKAKIIGEGGLSKEDFEETIDEIDQAQLDMGVFRNVFMMTKKGPTDTKQAKAIKIQERIELEQKKRDEQKAMTETYIRWVLIYDSGAGSRRYMEVEVDNRATANFLTRGMAYDRRLQVHSLEKPFEGYTMNSDLVCYEYAIVNLYGGDQDEHHHIEAKFYILPANPPPNDPRIDKPIVGRSLEEDARHLLQTEDPRDTAWATKMTKETETLTEEREQEGARVQKYQLAAMQTRDATRKNKDDRNKKAKNRGSSSRVRDKQGS